MSAFSSPLRGNATGVGEKGGTTSVFSSPSTSSRAAAAIAGKRNMRRSGRGGGGDNNTAQSYDDWLLFGELAPDDDEDDEEFLARVGDDDAGTSDHVQQHQQQQLNTNNINSGIPSRTRAKLDLVNQPFVESEIVGFDDDVLDAGDLDEDDFGDDEMASQFSIPTYTNNSAQGVVGGAAAPLPHNLDDIFAFSWNRLASGQVSMLMDDDENDTSVESASPRHPLDEDDDDDLISSSSSNSDNESVMSSNEVHDLLGLMRPHQIQRIRDLMKLHVQVLVQTLLGAATTGRDDESVQLCGRMIENLVEVTATETSRARTSIPVPFTLFSQINDKLLTSWVGRFRTLYVQTKGVKLTAEEEKIPYWRRPVALRFLPLLLEIARDSNFDKSRVLVHRRTRRNDDYTVAWRCWQQNEINLIIIGLERYGIENTAQISQYLLPTRVAGKIQRVIKECQENKLSDDGTPVLRDVFKPLVLFCQLSVGERPFTKREDAILNRYVDGEVEDDMIDAETGGVDWIKLAKLFFPHRCASSLQCRVEHLAQVKNKKRRVEG